MQEVLNDDRFYKKEDDNTIWWYDGESDGEFLFSFDKKKVYNLFADYPHNMTSEEVRIFDEENPYWAEFFSDRK